VRSALIGAKWSRSPALDADTIILRWFDLISLNQLMRIIEMKFAFIVLVAGLFFAFHLKAQQNAERENNVMVLDKNQDGGFLTELKLTRVSDGINICHVAYVRKTSLTPSAWDNKLYPAEIGQPSISCIKK
jgi:hypothetical protein